MTTQKNLCASASSTSRRFVRMAAIASCFLATVSSAQPADGIVQRVLRNGTITCTVFLQGDQTLNERLQLLTHDESARQPFFQSDGDFGLDIMYADWRAPGKQNNADNPVVLTKKDFTVVRSEIRDQGNGRVELTVYLKGKDCPFDVRILYRLDPGEMCLRKSLSIMDTVSGLHLLRRFWPVRASFSGITSVVKEGDFGQPVAVLLGEGGAFFGMEYPAAENRIRKDESQTFRISCGQEFGERIGKTPHASEWVVEALTPDRYVQRWFYAYLDGIRVAPLRPYTLYNSWYDLRSPEYPRVPKENVMSEASAMKMIALLRKNMIDRHGIALDAFVLDDGWDVYRSDWVLRREEFPNGFRPLADELRKTNTALGVWLGPIGGYSFRELRTGWMKEHGYELVGDQLCVAGKKYSRLLKQRVTDFAANDGVAYYKWDGIQFSCNEPDHGHPIDIYSRRAVLESVIGLCSAVREKRPSMFLNITSGTWLSPWWVKYANTIWMDGADYGYADVPSISQRDAAITYRDFVLYEDFSLKGLWFPVANLMTHGIIKGKLEMLGSPEEPLDKFTDDALLYVARGVSMYELYISPDIISEGEWNTLARAIAWAKDRFPVLKTTFMIGGNPMKRESYGYAHFAGSRGILAARNPFVTPASLAADLTPAQGLDAAADSLVLERVYPTRWIDPKLHRSGETLTIPLDGYETAVYEIYPLAEARSPLLAGVVFDVSVGKESQYAISFHSAGEGARLLNPGLVEKMTVDGKNADAQTFRPRPSAAQPISSGANVTPGASEGTIDVSVPLETTASGAKLAVLLTPAGSGMPAGQPVVRATKDGAAAAVRSEQQEGLSRWYTVDVAPGRHSVSFGLTAEKGNWKGDAQVWLIANQRQQATDVSWTLNGPVRTRPEPPHPWLPGEIRRTVKLGELHIEAHAGR